MHNVFSKYRNQGDKKNKLIIYRSSSIYKRALIFTEVDKNKVGRSCSRRYPK